MSKHRTPQPKQVSPPKSDLFDLVIRRSILFLIFFLPLWFGRFFDLFQISFPGLHTNIIFNLPKVVLFAALVDIVALLFAVRLLFLSEKLKIILPSRWLCWSIFCFAVVNILATVASAVPWLSLFGQYERGQGLLILLHYLLFLFLFVTHFTREDIPKILRMISAAALFVAVYALLQFFGLDPNQTSWSAEALKGRVFSTLGHPNYLAYYLLFTIPVTIYLLVQARQQKKNIATGILVASLLLQLVVLYLTGSRGAWLGLLVGGFVTATVYAIQSRSKRIWQGIGIFMGLVIVGSIVALSVPAISNKLRLNEENLRSVETRLVLWQDTSRMIAERPILGYGLDTFYIYFPRFKSATLLDLENYNLNADRAHNIILDTAQASGLPGVIIYLFLLGVLWWQATSLENDKRPVEKPRDRGVGFLILTATLALFVANLWGFPTVIHDVYFWLFAGILILAQDRQYEIKVRGRIKMAAVLLIIGGLWSGVYYLNSYRADHSFFTGVDKKNVRAIAEALALNPYNPVYLDANAYTSASYPADIIRRLELFNGPEEYGLGLLKATWAVRQNDIGGARTLYQGLITLYPHMPTTYLAYGELEKQSNNCTAAVSVYEKLLAISPRYWELDEDLSAASLATRERYRLFFKENPDFRSIFTSLAWCGWNGNNPALVVQYAPHMTEGVLKYQWLSLAEKKNDRSEEAKKYFDKCLQFKDNSSCSSSVPLTPR